MDIEEKGEREGWRTVALSPTLVQEQSISLLYRAKTLGQNVHLALNEQKNHLSFNERNNHLAHNE